MKKTKAITIGDIIFPSKNPNLIHNLFKDMNKLGLMWQKLGIKF